MGRRSGDTEGAGPGLGQDDSGNLAKLTADLVDQCPARLAVRFAPCMALAEQSFDASCRRRYQLARTAVEIALFGFARLRPYRGDLIVEIILRSSAEPTVDQAQRMANARQPRHGFRIDIRACLVLVLRDQA